MRVGNVTAAQSLTPVELLDIGILAILFYALVSILRRSVSPPVMVAGGVLFGIYALAGTLDLQVTASVMRGSLVVALVVLAVAFQPDIRRVFHQLGSWRTFRKLSPQGAATVDELVEAVNRMAESKTGALIAIRGTEDWRPHLEGGLELGGRVSGPLLESIFAPNTPGHDGAVLLESSRVTLFAAHLPLSVNLEEVGDHGTRHAAALGLAERCDALVLIVSEESGGVSIARDGTLKSVTIPEAKQVLQEYWDEHYGQPKSAVWRRVASPAFQNLVVAVALAAVVWLQASSRREVVSQTFTLPLRLENLDSEWWLREPIPGEVHVTLSGPEQALQSLEPEKLVIELDLGRLAVGRNEFTLAPDNLRLPSSLTLKQAEPQPIILYADRIRTLEVPVRAETTGKPPAPLELVSATAQPGSLSLQIPGRRSPPSEVLTEPIDLAKIQGNATVESRIILPPDSRLPAGRTGKVQVKIELKAAEPRPPR